MPTTPQTRWVWVIVLYLDPMCSTTHWCWSNYGLPIPIPIICLCRMNSKIMELRDYIDLWFSLQVSRTWATETIFFGSLVQYRWFKKIVWSHPTKKKTKKKVHQKTPTKESSFNFIFWKKWFLKILTFTEINIISFEICHVTTYISFMMLEISWCLVSS